ncbi:MAG: hypothetical protein QX198_03455 [Methylococcaceae bacterium]
MKASPHIIISIAFIALTACSTQTIRPDTNSLSTPAKLPALIEDTAQNSGQNPPLTISKGNKTLNLVRIMDGGACKNDFQGAKGAFLIYADSTDIDRIKREQGAKVFSDFEKRIQAFSIAALQEAIDATNLAENPFALGVDETQEKLTKQLSNNFRNNVVNAVTLFEKATGLTIDVIPFAPSFIFYQQGCAATQLEPEI